ncbi:DNA primase [Aureococcus anophagefferens]|nr:DNA primase [Aureococcus anophagefferens]
MAPTNLRAQLRNEPLGWLMEELCVNTPPAPTTGDDRALLGRIAGLRKRVEALEKKRGAGASAGARRAVADARASASAVCTKWVGANYYGKPMRSRAAELGCDVRQMTKTMLVENKQWRGDDPFARENAKHYLVVVQYAAAYDAQRMRSALSARTGLSKNQFNFRVADEATMAALSGFEHNAVTPFGMAEKRVPVVLASAARDAPGGFIWMGAGHTDLKLGVTVADFLKRFDPLVLDVSAPRDEREWDAAPGGDAAPKGEKEKKEKAPPKEKKDKAPAPKGGKTPKAAEFADHGDDDDTAASRLALVVGRIVEAWPHPESDKLFCEKIDCGEAFGGVRSIASGLQAFYKVEDLKDRLVLVIANLKAKKLGGFPSQGMVLCASNAAHDRTDKKKLFLKAQPHFTTKGGVAYYKGKAFAVGGANCTAPAEDGAATMIVSNRRQQATPRTPAVVSRHVLVSLYERPPQTELTLDEFEIYAVDRLKILRTIDALKQKGFKPRELEAELAPVLAQALPLRGSAEHVKADERKDQVSHFILRLGYSRTEEMRRWFLTQECALFKHRLGTLSGPQLGLFLAANGLKFEEVSDADAIDLIGRREVYLEKGYAYVPAAKLHAIVVARFRSALSRSLAKASSSLAAAAGDPRLSPLLNNIEKHDLSNGKDLEDDDVEGIHPEQIDALAKQSMPLCMQQLHGALKRDHKLKHWGRQQYGLFLKAAGLSMEDQLRFFQAEFTKIMTVDAFSKEYAYNIRHRYGKEGKRTEYSPYGCYKLIMDMAPGPGEYHGCPYKHYDDDHLASILGAMDISRESSQAILGQAKSKNYQLACQKHFEVTHPKAAGVAARPDGVGNHPNAWFKASRIYHKEVHEAKNPDAVKQVEPAAAPAPAPPAVLLAN